MQKRRIKSLLDNKLCDVCIGIYNPIKHKLKNCRDYPIICDEDVDGWEGLRDRFRGGCILKNRSGESDKFDSLNFFGEIGLFQEMPKAKEITDWRPYLSLTQSDKEEQEETGLSSTAQIDNFTFEF